MTVTSIRRVAQNYTMVKKMEKLKDSTGNTGQVHGDGNQSRNIISGYEHIQGKKLNDRSDLSTIKDDKFRSYQEIRDKLCQLIQANIKVPENGVIVDLGTGSNVKIPLDIRDMIEKNKGMVIGLEITDKGAAEAGIKRNEVGFDALKVLRSNSIMLPFKNDCIDVVAANLSIHHIFPEPMNDCDGNQVVKNSFENIFYEAYRVLQYDGQLIVSESVDPTTDMRENMLFRGIHKTIHNLDAETRRKYEQTFGVDKVASLFKLASKEWGKDIENEPPVAEYLISPSQIKSLAITVGFRVIKYIRVSPALAHFVFVKD